MARVLITVLRLLQLVLSLASIGLSSYGASFFYGVAECLTLKLDCAASARFHSWLTIYPTCSYQLFRDGKQAFNTIILLFHDRRFYSVDLLIYLELVSKFVPRLHHPYAAIAVEATNTILYFAGFIALAIFLGSLTLCGGPVCSAGRS